MPRLRVVLAENGLAETALTLRSLCAEGGRTLELVLVERRENLEAALRRHCPDVALLTLSMLQPDAPSRLRVLQANCPSIPFILLVEPADKEIAESCLAMGAADYLIEGFLDERTMNRALRAAIGQRRPMHGEVDASWTRVGEREWEFILRVGAAEELPVRALVELTEMLKKNVRKTDSVEQISGLELAIRLRDVDELKSAGAQRRIEGCLRTHSSRLLRGVNVSTRVSCKNAGALPTNEMKVRAAELVKWGSVSQASE
ncbi:MAG TPA: response regulator [Dongiaceae bacterium]|nr:response regulator [Dongiaceae bacterium]